MTIVGEAFIRIRPDDAGFSGEAEKGILSKVGGIASKAAGVFAAGFVVKQGIDFFGGLIGDATESRRVLAETEQAIKATGGAAGVTAKQVSDMSESMSRQTGIDDELIQTGANLLLTFKNIRNETGKGNDIFNQANQAVLDLSKQFGGVEGSAVQVGKALNDPIAGITALGRAGVTFTDQQKEQIKALVETGDVLGAQKIILGEINAQVGGQAAAQATAADRLRVVWGNLREELGTRLLPIVDKVATFLADRLPGALDKVGKVLGPVFAGIAQGIALVRSGFIEGNVSESTGFLGVLVRAGMLAQLVVQAVRSLVASFIAADGDITSSGFNGTMERVGFIIRQVADFVRDNLVPILAVIGVAFFGVAGALVLAYVRFQVVRDVIGAVVDFLTGTVVPAIAAFAGFVSEQFGNLTAFVRENWAGIQEAISHVVAVVQAVIENFVAVVQAVWQAWGDELLNIVSIVWDQMRNFIETAVNIIAGVIRAVVAVINGDWGEAWDAIKDILSAAWEYIRETVVNALRILREVIEGGVSAIVAIVGDVPGKILDALGDVGGLLYDAGRAIINGLKDGIVDAVKGVYDFVSGIAGKIADLKGPLDKDRRLLVPAGVAIMQGLQEGIASQQPALEALLAKVTESITGMGTGQPGAALGAGLAGAAKQYFDYALESGDWLNDYLMDVAESDRAALKALAQRAIAEKQAAVNSGRVSQSSVDPYYLRPDQGFRPSQPGATTQPVNTLANRGTTSSGPFIGQLIIHANGDGRSIAAAVEDSIRRLVADGTVGRAMAKRSETMSRR